MVDFINSKRFRAWLLIPFALLFVVVAAPQPSRAQGDDDIIEASSSEVGEDASSVNSADEEESEDVTETGTLIEIGNTTAEETTVVVRTADDEGNTEDVTLQIETDDTDLDTDSGGDADLSDWIAGDQLTFRAERGKNSGELKAKRIQNRSFKRGLVGRNGFVKEIRASENELDIEWGKQIFTLNTEGAKLVAGTKNPASLTDFKVGDRVRARVKDDGDQNPQTWDASIVVVLRRGESLFMRVTRWVVPAKIITMPTNTSTFPYMITAEILPSKFHQDGDVNNVLGEPGDRITIHVTESTQLVRRFLGKAIIGEFAEGDTIKVIGRHNETTGHLVANVIKNEAIQRLGVALHIGEVKSVDAGTYTLTVTPASVSQGATWTVKASATTKVMEMGATTTFSALAVGDKVRVRGTANRLTKMITNVTGIAILPPLGDNPFSSMGDNHRQRGRDIPTPEDDGANESSS